MASQTLRYDPAARYDYKVEDIEYRREGGRSWPALTYQPQGAGPFPALLEIHGGAWNNGDRTGAPALAEGLAASGVVVASIDFRMGGEDPYPSSLQDINYATRWLKQHAGDFHADAATVGGLGISSGGHLIMLSAMRPRDPRYAALPLPGGDGLDATLAYVISLWGVLDPLGRYRMARAKGLDHYLTFHDAYFGSEATQEEANPLMILRRGERVELPPALLIQGTADEGVPEGMVAEVASRYQAAGGQAELAWFEGMPHGIAGWPNADVARMVERIKGFIAARG
ncbi:MAG TPA: alpha/beta hydrolase [Chloroflexota bacterium]|jgi:acetyl esterase/lipase